MPVIARYDLNDTGAIAADSAPFLGAQDGSYTDGAASVGGRAVLDGINDKVKIYQVKKKKLPDSLDEAFRGEPAPKDPWGNEFVYRKGGTGGFDIISYGSDGREGGWGSAADTKLSEFN